MKEVYDLIVLGGGSAGYSAAVAASNLNKKVLMIEKGPFGGLCILKGCMPSKDLIYSARLVELINKSSKLGIHSKITKIDTNFIITRKNKIIKSFADYRKEALKKHKNITLISGEAKFVSDKEVMVNNETIEGKFFLISTGSSIFIPPIQGLKESKFITSDEALELKKLPKSLLVVGAGPVSIELCYYFNNLGVKVIILERHEHILEHLHKEDAEELQDYFRKKGMTIFTNTNIEQVAKKGSKKQITFMAKNKKETITVDEILIAAGRKPNIESLSLEKAGIKLENNRLLINKFLQTNKANIYAAGDVSSKLPVVNVAVSEGELAALNMFTSNKSSLDYNMFPMAVFCHPEIAWIGITRKEAEEKKLQVKIGKLKFEDLGKAELLDETFGHIMFIVDKKTNVILGVQIIGNEASDLIHEAIPLLYFKAKLEDLKKMPHLHPTFGEIYSYLVDEMT